LAKSVCGFNKFETRSGKPGITPEKRFIVKVDALHERFLNTISHTPWPSFKPRCSNLVSGR